MKRSAKNVVSIHFEGSEWTASARVIGGVYKPYYLQVDDKTEFINNIILQLNEMIAFD